MMRIPATPTPDVSEPNVLVSMADDLVVIRPPDQLDVDDTRVLVDAAASAVTAGAVVMVDLARGDAREDLLWFRPQQDENATSDAGDPAAEVLGPGWVRLTTRNAYWTIDLAHGRLFRADALVDPHFVPDDSWTAVWALWITCTHVTALTDDGTYVSTRTSWTNRRTPTLSIPA